MKNIFTFISAFLFIFPLFLKGQSVENNSRELVLEESFDVYPFENWEQVSMQDDGQWDFGVLNPYEGLGYAVHLDLESSCIDYLVSPQFLVPENGALVFFDKNSDMEYYEGHELFISTNSGDPSEGDFVKIASFDEATDGLWKRHKVDLSAYANQEVYVAFVYTGNYATTWKVDNMSVYGVPQTDIEVYGIQHEGACIVDGKIWVSSFIENASEEAVSGIHLSLSLGEEVVREKTIDLAIDEKLWFTFDSIYIGDVDDVLTVKATYAGDEFAGNNTVSCPLQVIQNPVYGFVTYSDGGEIPYGPVVYEATDPSRLTNIVKLPAYPSISSGTIANGVWYGSRILMDDFGLDVPEKLVKIDLLTGAMTEIGATEVMLHEMAWDPYLDRLIGIAFEKDTCRLMEIDIETGKASLIATQAEKIPVKGLTVTRNGNILGIDNLGKIYKVNPNTFDLKEINITGVAESNYAQSLACDYNTGDLYYNVNTLDEGLLYKLDSESYEASLVGSHQSNALVTASALNQKVDGYTITFTGSLAVKNDFDFMTIDFDHKEYIAFQNEEYYDYSLTLKNIAEGEYNYMMDLDHDNTCEDLIMVDKDLELECAFGSGLEDKEVNSIILSPNPANTHFIIQGLSEGNYALRNMNGTQIKSGRFEQNKSISIADLYPGIYFVQILSAEGYYSRKLLVE